MHKLQHYKITCKQLISKSVIDHKRESQFDMYKKVQKATHHWNSFVDFCYTILHGHCSMHYTV